MRPYLRASLVKTNNDRDYKQEDRLNNLRQMLNNVGLEGSQVVIAADKVPNHRRIFKPPSQGMVVTIADQLKGRPEVYLVGGWIHFHLDDNAKIVCDGVEDGGNGEGCNEPESTCNCGRGTSVVNIFS